MLTLPELKDKINHNQDVNSLIIFKCEDEDFIPISYIKQWAILRCTKINYISDLNDYPGNEISTFDDSLPEIYIYETEYLEELDSKYKYYNNLFIICERIKKEIIDEFKDIIVNIPKLEVWQIKDYINLNYPGLDDNQIEWLIKSCNGSIYKTLTEMDKLINFPPATRKALFEELKRNGQFDSVNEATVFDLIAAIQNKDIQNINNILINLDKLNISSIGFNTLLYNNFKKLIKVWLNKQPTEINTGLKSNQIWAINKLPRTYSQEQLLKIFKLITSIDYKIKSGELPESILMDYIITQILTI